MHSTEHLGPRIIFEVGGIPITETVVITWIIMAVLIIFSLIATRKFEKVPKGIQNFVEAVVESIYNLVAQTMGKDKLAFAPYIGTLFIFLLLANSMGLFGLRPVTADLNATFALATLTFIMIHFFSIRARGIGGYIKHMADPIPLMLPINIIGEIAFPLSISFRLFGNITGGMIIMALLFSALHAASEAIHLPIPLLQAIIPIALNVFFDVFEPILQAFIFTMLTMTFVALGMTKHESH